MVFGVPVFLEPTNWQQQDEQTGSGGSGNPPPKTTSFSASIRPPLMLERSRVATAQPPEPALKCPRCESTNTKFCYYNNYSKSQPRHFCKTCRRYWTRGGALRNVPVGGGCRRNKRSKNNNTRSPPISDRAAASDGAIAIPTTAGIEVLGLDQNQIPQPPPQLPFMANFHQFTDFTTDVGFAGTHSLRSDRLGGSSSAGGGGGEIDYSVGQNSGSVGQWRLPHQNQHLQIGFSQADGMIGLESAPAPPQGLFPFDMEQQYYAGGQLRAKPSASNLSLIKSEENQNLPRQFLGLQHGSDQYAWTDLYLSGFTSSTSPLL